MSLVIVARTSATISTLYTTASSLKLDKNPLTSNHGVPKGALNLDRGLGLVFPVSVRLWDVIAALRDVSSGYWVNIMPFSSPEVAQRVSVDC